MGVECCILTWTDTKPNSGIQAAAREARYDLLGKWCLNHGVLHLLVGHNKDDQKETGTIIQEIQKGFTIKDRLLRPSLVGVSKKSQNNNEKDQQNMENSESK